MSYGHTTRERVAHDIREATGYEVDLGTLGRERVSVRAERFCSVCGISEQRTNLGLFTTPDGLRCNACREPCTRCGKVVLGERCGCGGG